MQACERCSSFSLQKSVAVHQKQPNAMEQYEIVQNYGQKWFVSVFWAENEMKLIDENETEIYVICL